MDREIAWKKYDESDLEALSGLADEYIEFISQNKTERECCKTAVAMAKEHGYISLDEAIASGKKLACGDKVYAVSKGKAVILVQLGQKPMSEGLNILGAHIDSPRLDLKQNPLYESNGLALLDTHYYGGIKKYQWTALPLAMHGVVAKTDGSVVDVVIGEDDADPVFCVSDLLVHLAQTQLEKTGAKVVEGEDLDILVGNQPKSSKDKEEKDLVKARVLDILKEKYGIEEEDFVSAELEMVPAGSAKSLGFDKSMVIGYGQDDRVCAFGSLIAQLEVGDTQKCAVCVLVDKEEIGSVGATGMESDFFADTIAEVLNLTEFKGEASLVLKRLLKASKMLSSDVSAAFDPTYASAFEAKNAAYLGKGLVFNKYTGARGKSGSNDASAEYVACVRSIMDAAEVSYQTAELGKVDLGGGGTIAYIPAKFGMDVIDSGVAVLSMHAPWEVTSQADIYEAFKGYQAFLRS
ncbi:MAG: aminopeptidase [Eggerthellaceae bacterium]|nr:aminopeptidase [Eggerthellaceae bacterium]